MNTLGRILVAMVVIAFLHGLLALFAYRLWVWSRVYKARREERESRSNQNRNA